MNEQFWTYVFMTSIMFNRFFNDMSMSALGPSQPYLAFLVGVDVDIVNFVWSVSGISGIVIAVFIGVFYKKMQDSDKKKMALGCFCEVVAGIMTACIPNAQKFEQVNFNERVDKKSYIKISKL